VTTSPPANDDFLSDPRLRMLFDTIAEVNSTLDLEELQVRVVDRTLDLTGAERGILLLGDGEGHPRVARDSDRNFMPQPMEYSHVVADRVLREGKSEVHDLQIADTGEFPLTDSVNRLGLRTVMCVPLVVDDGPIGVLYVDSRISQDAVFGPADLKLFEALAGQIAIAIEKARLHEAALAQKALDERVRIAAEIQSRLVPPRCAEFAGMDVCGICRPYYETGGDYFDISMSENRLRLAVGDVQGKGLKAALFMLTARAHLRSSLHWERDAEKVFHHLDDELSLDMMIGEFMTLLLVEVDLEERCFRYVSAGHEPPLLWRAAEQAFEPIEGHGPALALRLNREYRISEPVSLRPDDILVLSTDGIPEAMRADKRLFGEERQREAIRALRKCGAESIVAGMVLTVEDFLGGASLTDDLTMVVMKVGG